MQYTDKETKTLMMLPTDVALIRDGTFRKYVELYAKDQEAFFRDFADAYSRLLARRPALLSARASAEIWRDETEIGQVSRERDARCRGD